MTLSRRSTIKAIGVVGTGAAVSGTALAVNEHQDDERNADEVPAEGDVGAIRIGHFSPDAPNVDVYVDGQRILSDVGYGQLSPYLEIAPGTYTVSIAAAGDDEPVYQRTIAVGAEFYTAAAIGELQGGTGSATDTGGGLESDAGFGTAGNETGNETAGNETVGGDFPGNGSENASVAENGTAGNETAGEDATGESSTGTETGSFDVLLLVDSQTDDVQEGTAPLRFVHAVPDAPAVDVATGETGATIFEDVAFTEPSGYVPVEPGTRTLELFPADEGDLGGESSGGNGNDSTGNESEAIAADTDVISQPDPVAAVELELRANTTYTVFAIGYLEQRDDAELTVSEDEYATGDGFGTGGSGESDGAASDTGESTDSSANDRPFSVRVAVDGEMGGGDATDENGNRTANESTEGPTNSTGGEPAAPTDGRNATDEHPANESTPADD